MTSVASPLSQTTEPGSPSALSSETILRVLAESGRDLIWASNSKWHPVFINRQWERYTGLATEQLLTMGWSTVMHPEDIPRMEAQLAEASQTGQPYEAQYRYRRHDGAYCWFYDRGLPLRDATGKVTHWIGMATEITHLKETEESLQQARDIAETSDKSKDQFIAVLSHELRTPLTPVLMAVQMMEADPTLSDDQRESVVMIRRNVELEVKLIDDLLDVTRIAKGKLEMHFGLVDLHKKLRHVIHICNAGVLSKQLNLTLELKADPWVQADATRIQQVLWNLLKNAVKFTPVGGHISIRSSNPSPERVALTIQDDGVGIDLRMLARIFDAFEQADMGTTHKFGGLGLGLTISKGLVNLHGGTLTAHSEGRNKGSTFTLELPTALPTKVPSDKACAGLSPAKPRNSYRILLVEDHLDTAKITARLLKQFGYDVIIAESVADALRAADAEPFDALVSDIGLPDGNGLDLMRQLRLKRPMKGIVLSGFGMEDDIQKSKEAGFAAHLTKPVKLDVLEKALRKLCSKCMANG